VISFTNLCSYRLVFSKNLMKIGGLRASFFLPTIIGTGKGANSRVAQKRIFIVAVFLDFFIFAVRVGTHLDAKLGQKKGGFRLLVSK
jgi:hypothetical protein